MPRAYWFNSKLGTTAVAKLASDAAKRRAVPAADPVTSEAAALLEAARAGDTFEASRARALFGASAGLPPSAQALRCRRYRRARGARLAELRARLSELQRELERKLQEIAEREERPAREAAEAREFAKWWTSRPPRSRRETGAA